MEKLQFDIGVVEYGVPGGGVLRFNPADPGLYGRFVEAQAQMEKIEQSLLERAEGAAPEVLLALMHEADTKAKALLGQVFGQENDFHKALNGVSLLAVCQSGKTVAESLFAALGDVLEQGAERLVQKKLSAARKAL